MSAAILDAWLDLGRSFRLSRDGGFGVAGESRFTPDVLEALEKAGHVWGFRVDRKFLWPPEKE